MTKRRYSHSEGMIDVNQNSTHAFGDLLFVGESQARSSEDWASRDVAAALEHLPVRVGHVTPECLADAARAGWRDGRGGGAIILFLEPGRIAEALEPLDREIAGAHRIIAYCCGDLSGDRDGLNRALPAVDEIWVPSRFALESLGHVRCPVHVVPLPVSASQDAVFERKYFHLLGQRTVFLAVVDAAASLERQNPGAAIAAFREAFPGRADVEMVLLLQNAAAARGQFRRLSDLVGAEARIWYWDIPLSHAETIGLIRTADALVSLHRANEFGLPIAQAMRAGTLVIASQHGGSADYTTAMNALTIPVCRGEPDHDGAVRAFQRVGADRNGFRTLIDAAASHDFHTRFEHAVRDRLSRTPGRIQASCEPLEG